jgi:hypothetical protein
MDLPKEKIGFLKSHRGEVTPEGWLVLDVANLDLDAVTKIYVDMRDVEAARIRGDEEAERLRKARELLGG